MPLLTQYATFFISPFGESSVCDELNRFLRSHRIIDIEKKLIDGERGTGWLFLVEYGGDLRDQAGNSRERVDYRAILNEQEFALFDRLRQMRKETAEQQGIPVYTVFTNEQLAGMVKKPPRTEKDLLAIPGVGEARARQYGDIFLKLFAEIARSHDETGG